MIRHRPKKRTGKYAALCLALPALAAASAYAGGRFGIRALYALCFSLVMFSFQIFIVFILSTYEYEIDGDIFRIYRILGRRRDCIFDLDLNYASGLIDGKDVKAYIKENGKPKKRLYCLCGSRKKRCRVLCYDAGAPFMLYFASDGVFAEAVRSHIR